MPVKSKRPAAREDARGGERSERQRADVEEHLVRPDPLRAPVDDRDRDRDRERGPRPEQRRAGDRADGAQRDRAAADLVADGQRDGLADADERDDREQARDVGRAAEQEPVDARDDAGECSPRRRGEPRRRESARKRGPCTASGRGVDCVRRSSRRHRLGGTRKGDDVLPVLGDDGEPLRAIGGHEQRVVADALDAVPALELRAVDGEVGLVDQLVRVGCVLRETGDADRHGRADRLARGLDLERRLGDGAPDSLGDLERLVGRRLRQEDRELLAAEPRRHVVVTELRPEDLRDSAEHGVPGEMAVRVVDVAEQVEVGHDQRQRPLEAHGATELLRQRRREVARVEKARLRVDARLLLQRRHCE